MDTKHEYTPRYDFTINQGDHFTKAFQYAANGTDGEVPVDLSSYSIRMQIRPYMDAEELYADLTIANGGVIITDAANGSFEIAIDEDVTAAWTWRTATYDIEFSNAEGQGKFRWLQGVIELSLETTHA